MGKEKSALKSLCALSLLSTSLFIFLAAAASEGATLSRLRVGYPSPSASFFPLFATKEAGLLEKYGFATEMVYVQGVQLVQVHVAGQLDFSTISSVVYLQASVEGGRPDSGGKLD
jgi:ABC-type nitrate/sulfonate/bicarbonate transport system substrate-binding protein